MQERAFVYTELQISVPFEQVPWQKLNTAIKQQPGFLNKTWLAGLGNHSAGGFYEFASVADAWLFVKEYFPAEARAFGVAQTTRVFAADATVLASQEMNSPHYEGQLSQQAAAFVYTELQCQALPFAELAPWRELNPQLKRQTGLLAKTWLSGWQSGSVGGFYAFDSLAHAQAFALDYFPREAVALNSAFYTRVFDVAISASASREMASLYYR